MRKCLIIGDVHFPFVDKKSLDRIYSIAAKEKPEIIVQIGDLYDHYAHAKFPRSHNIMTPRQEVERAHEMSKIMWQTLYKNAPNASCYQLLGNHDVRPYKRILEKYPEIERLMSFREFYTFKGVETIHDHRHELILDGIIYIHGYLSRLGAHCMHYQKPVVVGHSHRGGVFYTKLFGKKTIWELNVGFIANPNSTPLGYSPQRHVNWTLGCGIIDHLGPRFVAFE